MGKEGNERVGWREIKGGKKKQKINVEIMSEKKKLPNVIPAHFQYHFPHLEI